MLDRFLRDCRVSVRNEVKIQKLVIIFISFNDDLDGRPLCFACGTCFGALTSLALDQMGTDSVDGMFGVQRWNR